MNRLIRTPWLDEPPEGARCDVLRIQQATFSGGHFHDENGEVIDELDVVAFAVHDTEGEDA